MGQELSSIIVALISAAISLIALTAGYRNGRRLEGLKESSSRALEKYKAELVATQTATSKADEAQRLVARYRDPLIRTAYDLQSRLYNVLRLGGFEGGRDPDYFKTHTIFALAEFLGWLEIIRRDMQFLDLGAIEATQQLNVQIAEIQDVLASTSRTSDAYFLYRGHQRAIGELMIAAAPLEGAHRGPRFQTIGYVEFCDRLDTPIYMKWFGRLCEQIPRLPQYRSDRLAQLQHSLIDLIDLLDPDQQRISRDRAKVPSDSNAARA